MTSETDHLLREQQLAALAEQLFTDEDAERIFGNVQARIARDAVEERNRADLTEHITKCLNEAAGVKADCSAWRPEAR
jgi:hypothetical protein